MAPVVLSSRKDCLRHPSPESGIRRLVRCLRRVYQTQCISKPHAVGNKYTETVSAYRNSTGETTLAY